MKIQKEKEVELGVALFVCHSSVPSKQRTLSSNNQTSPYFAISIVCACVFLSLFLSVFVYVLCVFILYVSFRFFPVFKKEPPGLVWTLLA